MIYLFCAIFVALVFAIYLYRKSEPPALPYQLLRNPGMRRVLRAAIDGAKSETLEPEHLQKGRATSALFMSMMAQDPTLDKTQTYALAEQIIHTLWDHPFNANKSFLKK